MDKKILGNFVIIFPPVAHVIYTFVMKEPGTGIDLISVGITVLIAIISGAIGRRIKNKGEVDENF